MIAFLKKNDPIILMLSPLVIIISTIAEVLTSFEPINAMGSSSMLTLGWNPWLKVVLITVVAVGVAFLLNRIVQNSILIGRLSSLPMLILALLFGSIPLTSLALVPLLGVVLQLLILRLVLDLPEGSKTEEKAFNSGLIIGALTFIEPWTILLFWLPLQAMLSTGILSFKRIVIQLMGLLTPLYLVNAFFYLAAWPLQFPWNDLSFTGPTLPEGIHGLLVLTLLLFILIVTIISITQISSSSTLREKRKWYLVVSYFGVTLLLMTQTGFGNGLYYMLIPASVILARVALNGRKIKLINLGFFLLVLLVIAFKLW